MATVTFTDCTEFGVDPKTWSQLHASLIFGVAGDIKDNVKRNDLVKVMFTYSLDLPDGIPHDIFRHYAKMESVGYRNKIS